MRIYILAGGKSSRMGEDKGLKKLHEKPLIQYVIEAFKSISTDIFIVSNNTSYSQFGLPLIEDEIKEIGPLGGIYSALNHAREKNIFICSCDIPLINKKAINTIIQQYKNRNIVASYKQQMQPLFGIYRREHMPLILNKIALKEYKMMDLLNSINTEIVEFSPYFKYNIFQNINTQQDFEELINNPLL